MYDLVPQEKTFSSLVRPSLLDCPAALKSRSRTPCRPDYQKILVKEEIAEENEMDAEMMDWDA